MKTLVTGGAGFIGSAVVRRLLARGREVRCYLQPGASASNLDGLDVERVQGDINDRAAVGAALQGCDTLYHLAALYALWTPDPSLMYRVNVEGTKTVLWAAYKANLDRVIHTSSIAAVGRRSDGRPATEADDFTSRDWHEGDAYVRSKWLSERDALRFAQEGLPLTVVNPGFVFGERDRGPTPTGAFIVSALRRQVFGYLDSGFCAVDVEDVAEGHVLAAEKGRVGERYLLANHNVDFREFFALVSEVAQVRRPRLRIPGWAATSAGWAMEKAAHRRARPPVATFKAARYATHRHYFDSTRARTELGLPVTPLRDTIERSVRWFRTYGYE